MDLLSEEIMATLLGGFLVILGTRIQIINQRTNARKEVCIAFSIVINGGLRVVKDLYQITQNVKELEYSAKNKNLSKTSARQFKKDLTEIYSRINKLRTENEKFEVDIEAVLARLEHLAPMYVRRIALMLVTEIYSYDGSIESQNRIELNRARFILISKFSYWSQIYGWLAYRSSKNLK